MEIKNTRSRVLDAAERLFAERGFDGASIRDVTHEADVNLSAVNYHFRSKDELMTVVLDRTLCPLAAEICARMDADGSSLEGLLEAFVLPQLRLPYSLGPRGTTVARLLGRAFSEPNPAVRNLAIERWRSVYDRFAIALHKFRPELSDEEVNVRTQCVIGVVTFFIDDQVPETWRVIDLAAPEKAFARLRTFLLPGLQAAAGESPG